jgi:O-acetyl-ADP-ribose deacetylase (regulator of RNase III)
MIERATGNLLEAETEALVNAVNVAGVMGKGLALQFKRAFPENFRAYRRACENGELQLGRVFVHRNSSPQGPRFIVNFPTKGHWRDASRLEDIDAGLRSLVRAIRDLKIRSIAVPPLGCGLGGLPWTDVRPRIEAALEPLTDVDVRLYSPLRS